MHMNDAAYEVADYLNMTERRVHGMRAQYCEDPELRRAALPLPPADLAGVWAVRQLVKRVLTERFRDGIT